MGRPSKYKEGDISGAIQRAGTIRGAARLLGIPEAPARYYAGKYGIEDRAKDDDWHMSQRDVAEALGITVHAVKVAERSAIEKLRNSRLMEFAYGR